jgi:hypothetical protein
MAVLMRETGLQTVPRTMPQTSHKIFIYKKMGLEFSTTFQGYSSPITMALVQYCGQQTFLVQRQRCNKTVSQFASTWSLLTQSYVCGEGYKMLSGWSGRNRMGAM